MFTCWKNNIKLRALSWITNLKLFFLSYLLKWGSREFYEYEFTLFQNGNDFIVFLYYFMLISSWCLDSRQKFFLNSEDANRGIEGQSTDYKRIIKLSPFWNMVYRVVGTVWLSLPYAVFSPGCGLAGFPQENLRWRTKSQEDAPVRAQGHAMSQTDFRTSTVIKVVLMVNLTPQHFAWSNE